MPQSELIAIVYNQKIADAKIYSEQLLLKLGGSKNAYIVPAGDFRSDRPNSSDISLIITVGGDGTILRASRVAAPMKIPILGINMGRVGFMTELSPDEAMHIEKYLPITNNGWIEERSMLKVEVLPAGEQDGLEEGTISASHALNDVAIGRAETVTIAVLDVSVDGAHLSTYAADAVVVSTATGSTGYNLSAGGPILDPQSKNIVLKPVAAHLAMDTATVLPESAVVDLKVTSEAPAVLSVDGFQNSSIKPQEIVRVSRSPHTCRFIRTHPKSHFYSTLFRRLSSRQ